MRCGELGKMMNRLYWLLAPIAGIGVAVWAKRRHVMHMSPERINREARGEKYPPVSRKDIEYMRRVRERMLLGNDCTHPPLYS